MNLETLKNFADDLKGRFDLPGTASPEDQLKEPVAALIKAFGLEIKTATSHRTETHLAEHKVRPDIAIYAGGLICGYVELKAPGLGADAPKLKGKHNKAQWQKLKSLPNLIYTDGRDWALYRNGERRGSVVRLNDAPEERGRDSTTAQNAEDLGKLLTSFIKWQPIVPHAPRNLAEYLAPLTRFLRGEVEAALAKAESNVDLLAKEWRKYFFPDADNSQFADAYAQTVTYAMLMARLYGAEKLAPTDAAKVLGKTNGLLAEALKLLGQDGARDELRTGFELLQRSMEALDPHEFLKTKPDLWLYFYEDFLAAYDKKLRNDYGVYYTPREVVELQVRLASELLETRFGKKLGFADDGVMFLDPAVGTGTYLVATVRHALEKVRERSGEGAVPGRAAQMAANMYGFEILVGPYAVAHLRLTQALEGEGANLKDRLQVFLADTLESPHATPPGGLTLTHKKFTEEHEFAREVKQDGDILVCLGNPPYDRQHIAEGDDTTQRKGGWVRFGDEGQDQPIFTAFTEPASEAGYGVHLKNLYNDYVYFWRWALWRLFEQQDNGGVVTFITASSYLAGPGFVGMREVMRRTFDELWIIDLGGDNLGTRKTPNVFAIQTPVAIAIGLRGKTANPDTPAKTLYTKITGNTRGAKLKQLAAAKNFASLGWTQCASDWLAPLLPVGKGDFFDWPTLNNVFPLLQNGAQFKRTWTIGENEEVLDRRWKTLLSSSPAQRKALFKETRDRKLAHKVNDEALPGGGKLPLNSVKEISSLPHIIRYAYRSYNRQFALYDFRFGDFLRPDLWRLHSQNQIYLTTKFTIPLARGQALVATPYIPDMDHFRGSYGSKDVIPLFRDAEATQPNVTNGLLDLLSTRYGTPVTAEDLAAYVYALLGGQSYTERFWNELETPGPRVPLTKDADTFSAAAALGRRLIWLHTYGERFQGDGRGGQIPPGSAKCLKAVSDDPAQYPEDFAYSETEQQIRLGDGLFGPVAPEIWNFEVSGLMVVQSWLGYRKRDRAGKKSSPLDNIRPERWTPALTDEFLELLWVLEATLAMEPDLAAILTSVVESDCYKTIDLPTPSDRERKPPKPAAPKGTLL